MFDKTVQQLYELKKGSFLYKNTFFIRKYLTVKEEEEEEHRATQRGNRPLLKKSVE